MEYLTNLPAVLSIAADIVWLAVGYALLSEYLSDLWARK